MLERLEMRYRFCCWSMERESHILKNELQELPKMTRELIERLTKETHLNCRCKPVPLSISTTSVALAIHLVDIVSSLFPQACRFRRS